MSNPTEVAKSRAKLSDAFVAYKAVDVSAVNVTPPRPFKGITVGTPGNIVIIGHDGCAASLPVLAGVPYHYSGLTIVSSGTTADDIVALF